MPYIHSERRVHPPPTPPPTSTGACAVVLQICQYLRASMMSRDAYALGWDKASCARTCCRRVQLVVGMGPGASTSPIALLSAPAMPTGPPISMLLPPCRGWWSYFLLSRLGNVLVRFEEFADVHCLAAPDISVDCPVKGQLEGAAVEGAVALC